ncbi:MAG: serine/threonine protein kinase [Mycobacterium sp.]|nr:serine/threonine protein kinase [Mycobacterium sp.]
MLDKTRTVTKTAPPVTITQPAAPPPVQTPRRTPFVPPAPAPTTQRTTPRTSGNGDLGLRQPIRNPMCNGQGIVVVGSVTTPGRYAEGVQRLLDRYPGSSYLRTDQTCPSLRQATPEGHPIYAVYLPGGTTGPQLCAAVNAVGGDAYGKWLNYTDDPTIPIRC